MADTQYISQSGKKQYLLTIQQQYLLLYNNSIY